MCISPYLDLNLTNYLWLLPWDQMFTLACLQDCTLKDALKCSFITASHMQWYKISFKWGFLFYYKIHYMWPREKPLWVSTQSTNWWPLLYRVMGIWNQYQMKLSKKRGITWTGYQSITGQTTSHAHIYTYRPFKVTLLHRFELCHETGGPRGNPHRPTETQGSRF